MLLKSVQTNLQITEIPEPLVVHVSKFSEFTARKFANEVSRIKESGQPILPITIDSPGGDTYALMSILDTIEAAALPVLTMTSGKAMSAGAFLLACGTKGMRYATPRSTIMIHEAASGTFGKAVDMKSDTEETIRMSKQVFELLDKAAGKKTGTFYKMYSAAGRTDWFLTPTQAKKLGLIDEIGHPHLVAQIDCKWMIAK